MVNNKYLKLLEKKFRHQQKRYFLPLANAYRERNNLDKCISLFRQGLLAFPHYWAARVALGRALMERGDLDEALEELEAAIGYVPENLLLHRLLALLYFKRGELSKSATYCRLVLFMIPEDRECFFIMSEISKIQARGSQTEAIIEETKRFAPESWQFEQEPPEQEQPEQEPPEQEQQSWQPEQEPPEQEQQSWQFEQELPEQELPEQEQEEPAPQPERTKKKQEQEGQEEILTPTIAELYLSQGFAEKAIEIYQELLIRQPDRTEWMERIRSIQKERGIKVSEPKAGDLGGVSGGEHGDDSGEVLRQLEAWLKNIEKSGTN